MIHVAPLGAASPAWAALCARQPIYAGPQWRAFTVAITGAQPHHLGAFEGEALRGVLPLFIHHASVGCVINSQPWFGTPGGCFLADERARAPLLAGLAALIEATSPLSATIVLRPEERPHRAAYASALSGLGPVVEDQRVGQFTTLPLMPELLLGALRQKTRNQARKGLKQGFQISRSEAAAAWSAAAALHAENMAAIGGRAKPEAHFQALRLHLQDRALYLAHEGEALAAALIVAWGGGQTEYLIPAIAQRYRSRQPLSALLIAAMTDAIKAGRLIWSWGGTWLSQASLHHFKRGWGAQDDPYPYLIAAQPGLGPGLAALADAFPYAYLYPR
ncbi:GNAT family N-acetyltransferase [Myxococcota bacterium]|nr:GNAT family N-acetyltransferase [Myxococcota bacterium]MBU1429680.1 GNAT family N-acetyltransferase [Myxococcota bacterium]MBU1896930.1 GNAT family N-acetyltransferase [Myxococcota bacterium]